LAFLPPTRSASGILFAWSALAAGMLALLSTLFDGMSKAEAVPRARWGALAVGIVAAASGSLVLLRARRARLRG
jgi:hypothetical protein